MADEYIRKQDAVNVVANTAKIVTSFNYQYAIDALLALTPADVAPVVHGEWIPITSYNNVYKCSECGRLIDTIDGKNMVAKRYPYCHCGAKMDKE